MNYSRHIPPHIDIDEAFRNVIETSMFRPHEEILEKFWISLHAHIRWLEIEAWEIGGNYCNDDDNGDW
jgi:hypothetical protein